MRTPIKTVVVAAVASLGFAFLSAPAFADGLSFDTDHDVFVLPQNELTVRYNNNNNTAPVKATTYGDSAPHYLARPLLSGVKISEDFSNMSISQTPETITIECYDPGAIGPLGTNRFSKDFLKSNQVRIVSYPHDMVAKETGLPLSALKAMKSIMIFEVRPKGGGEPYNLFAFQHDSHMTFFARRMRSGRADVKNDPPVIVIDMRVGSTAESKANVDLKPPQTEEAS